MKFFILTFFLFSLNSFSYGPVCSGCSKKYCVSFEFDDNFEDNKIERVELSIYKNTSNARVVFDSSVEEVFYYRFAGNKNVINQDFNFNSNGVSEGSILLKTREDKNSNVTLKMKLSTKPNKRKIKYLIADQLDDQFSVQDFIDYGFFLGLASFELNLEGIEQNIDKKIKVKSAICSRQGS